MEDQEPIRDTLRQYCEKRFGNSVRVVCATNVVDALTRFRSERHTKVVITDYHVYGEETGGDLLEIIHRDQLLRYTPTILTTSEPLTYVLQRHEDIPPTQPYLRKPFHMSELVDMILKLIKPL